MKQKPAFVLDIRLPPGSFDVNVTPDKREIFMTDVGDRDSPVGAFLWLISLKSLLYLLPES